MLQFEENTKGQKTQGMIPVVIWSFLSSEAVLWWAVVCGHTKKCFSQGEVLCFVWEVHAPVRGLVESASETTCVKILLKVWSTVHIHSFVKWKKKLSACALLGTMLGPGVTKVNRIDLNRKSVMEISAVFPGYFVSHHTKPWMQIVFLFNTPQGGSYS